MNTIKKILSAIVKGVIGLFGKLLFNKIVIRKNKKTKINKNETENVSFIVNRNDNCEISENKFLKK